MKTQSTHQKSNRETRPGIQGYKGLSSSESCQPVKRPDRLAQKKAVLYGIDRAKGCDILMMVSGYLEGAEETGRAITAKEILDYLLEKAANIQA